MCNWNWIRKIEWMSVNNIKLHIISNCRWYQTADHIKSWMISDCEQYQIAQLCSSSWEVMCFIQYMNIEWVQTGQQSDQIDSELIQIRIRIELELMNWIDLKIDLIYKSISK